MSQNAEQQEETMEKKVAGLYKQYYREQFFSKVLPLIGKTGCITGSVYLPVHPWFIQGLAKNWTEISTYFTVEFTERTWMDSVLETVRDNVNGDGTYKMKEKDRNFYAHRKLTITMLQFRSDSMGSIDDASTKERLNNLLDQVLRKKKIVANNKWIRLQRRIGSQNGDDRNDMEDNNENNATEENEIDDEEEKMERENIAVDPSENVDDPSENVDDTNSKQTKNGNNNKNRKQKRKCDVGPDGEPRGKKPKVEEIIFTMRGDDIKEFKRMRESGTLNMHIWAGEDEVVVVECNKESSMLKSVMKNGNDMEYNPYEK